VFARNAAVVPLIASFAAEQGRYSAGANAQIDRRGWLTSRATEIGPALSTPQQSGLEHELTDLKPLVGSGSSRIADGQ
jgi:hypothetical protein